jgi:cytochrome c
MKTRWIAVLLGSVFATGVCAQAKVDTKAAEELMKKSGCAACHAIDKKVVGPAFKDVAAKYKNDKAAEGRLVNKVKSGGAGVWGSVPMVPNTGVKDEDIKTLVHWILSL